MKMNGSILEKKNHILKYWDCFFSCELNWASYMVFIGKTASKKIGILIRTTKFFFVRLPFITINLPYALARNIVVIFRLVLLDSTWICQASYQNRYVGLLVQRQLPLLNPWLIVKMQAVQVFSIGNSRAARLRNSLPTECFPLTFDLNGFKS